MNPKVNDQEAKQIADGEKILQQAQSYIEDLNRPYTDEELDLVLTEVLTAPWVKDFVSPKNKKMIPKILFTLRSKGSSNITDKMLAALGEISYAFLLGVRGYLPEFDKALGQLADGDWNKIYITPPPLIKFEKHTTEKTDEEQYDIMYYSSGENENGEINEELGKEYIHGGTFQWHKVEDGIWLIDVITLCMPEVTYEILSGVLKEIGRLKEEKNLKRIIAYDNLYIMEHFGNLLSFEALTTHQVPFSIRPPFGYMELILPYR